MRSIGLSEDARIMEIAAPNLYHTDLHKRNILGLEDLAAAQRLKHRVDVRLLETTRDEWGPHKAKHLISIPML